MHDENECEQCNVCAICGSREPHGALIHEATSVGRLAFCWTHASETARDKVRAAMEPRA